MPSSAAEQALMCAEQIATELTATNDLVVSQVAVGMQRSEIVEALLIEPPATHASEAKTHDVVEDMEELFVEATIDGKKNAPKTPRRKSQRRMRQ